MVKSEIGNDVEFEINSQFMKELRRNLFAGTDDEDAHEHVRRVLEIAYLFYKLGVTHDTKMLRVLPITLTRAARRWEKRLTAGVINTWDLLEKAFIRQYCPPFKTARKLEEIQSFQQGIDEMMYHAWERYSDLLYRCPHIDLNSHQKVQIFYTRLDIPTHIILNSKGFIPLMTPIQALDSIQIMADHSHNWYDGATTRERTNDSLDNVDMKKLKENIHAFQVSCKICKEEHLTKECPLKKEDKAVEQSKYIGSLKETIIEYCEDSIKNKPRMMNGLGNLLKTRT
ncbi:reverse transcriptase domain-containing protein [Tanacetum coccineum]